MIDMYDYFRDLDGEDIDFLHDVIAEAYYKVDPEHEITDQEIEEVWMALPVNVAVEGIQWGVGDTVFRDMVYEFLVSENWAEKNKDYYKSN